MTITQQPTFPNGTLSDMIYVVSGSFTTYAQHRYICRISSGSEVLSTVKQVSNLSGYGVFEVSRLLNDHMGHSTPWLVSGSSPAVEDNNRNINQFEIAFAEEYGTSPSSSITTTGFISGSDEEDNQVIPAVVERDSGDFNWASSSYDGLTNCPNVRSTLTQADFDEAIPVSASDYITISTLNGIGPKGLLTSVDYLFYDENLDEVYDGDFSPGIGSGTLEGKLIHVGAGPKNIIDVNQNSTPINDPDNYPYYAVRLTYASGTSDYHLFHNKCFNYKGTNFAFINKLGVWDYYRASLVDTERESFSRETYKAPYVDYSTKTSTIGFDYARRGDTQYYASFVNNFTAETDWLTTKQATWLFELFESPTVYVQDGDQFKGIIITNAEEEYKTNARGQKVFKFTIQYRLSNAKHARY